MCNRQILFYIWRNRPCLPSRVGKTTAALAAKAYNAAGQAASALHVHQAKALKKLHNGSSEPGLLLELSTATDLTLRVLNVKAMSSLVGPG